MWPAQDGDLRDEFGRRPLMAELLHRGYLPQTLRGKHDHWFAFLDEQGDLSDVERRVLTEHGDWLRFIETTSLTRSWKMVVLRVLLDSDALLGGARLNDHATKARAYLLGHPVLRADLQPSSEMSGQRGIPADHHRPAAERGCPHRRRVRPRGRLNAILQTCLQDPFTTGRTRTPSTPPQ